MNETIKLFIEKGYLVEPNFLTRLENDEDRELILRFIENNFIDNERPVVLDENFFLLVKKHNMPKLDWMEFERSKVDVEKGRDSRLYDDFVEIIDCKEEEKSYAKPEIKNESGVLILKNYKENVKKREVQDFVKYFKNRYESLKNILKTRPELVDATSINRILNRDRGQISIIGIVSNKKESKNGNIILTVEDLTGQINVIVNSNKKELFELAKDTLMDEVIGIVGMISKDVIFCNNLIYPDVPIGNGLKKCNEEVYAAFISDIEFGSKLFFKNEFLRFIDWINGKNGSQEQLNIANKVKYLFISGDNVAGVGVYPGQENDLDVLDIYDQYKQFTDYIKTIRNDVEIIICGGNHDALRLSEPQPVINRDLAPDLHEMSNVHLITNPSLVNIHSSENFPGFDVLVYHGGSFPYIAENVDSIRKAGRLKRIDLIMKYIIQRRHLAPSHSSTLYIPDIEKDNLVIDKVPDLFVSGHIHDTTIANYRNITLMNAGCWTGITENQEKRGLIPDPCKAFMVNLKTREIKVLNFKD